VKLVLRKTKIVKVKNLASKSGITKKIFAAR
jgi:hypothetical protein